MKTAFETRDIPLNTLALHPDNVRASAGYEEAQIAALAANIRECGLLQPLLVAPMGEDTWGVLAGGRRLAALKLLAKDKTAKGYTASMPVPCRIAPVDEAAHVTLSYSENALQLPMDAIDRFEAFAAMRLKDGADIPTIARTFAISERTVKEALRLGNIHPAIRQAHRDGVIDLEALKSFDAHPDPEVQHAAFETLTQNRSHGRLQAWEVRNHFRDRALVRAGDPLGRLVLEGYRAEGGTIIADLIEEDSILADTGLIETVLRRVLADLAEERRAALGLAWAEALVRPSWDDLHAFGRVYAQPRADLTDAQTAEVDRLQARIEEIEAIFEEEREDIDELALRDEVDTLGEAIDRISYAYSAFDAGLGGVIAVWTGSRVDFHDGMVRPEDMPARDTAPKPGITTGATAAPAAAAWSAALQTDMAHVRTRAVALALAQSPALARDYADFLLCRPVFGRRSMGLGSASTIRVERPESGAAASAAPEGSLKAIGEVFGQIHAGLDLGWADLPDANAFAAFRALDPAMRAQVLAAAVAETLTPTLPGKMRDPVRRTVEAEALPRLRDVWTPDEVFLARLTKPKLIAILSEELELPEQAVALAAAKKSELVRHLAGLFAEPYATLTDAQRQRVLDWCPDELATQAAPELTEVSGADADEDGDVWPEDDEEAEPEDSDEAGTAEPAALEDAA